MLDEGSTSDVRGHWLTGPLDLIIDYRASSATIARVRTGLQAVQFDTLTAIDRFGAEMSDFNIISPLFDYMPYYGNRTVSQQHTTELVVRHLFSNASFMHNLMRDAFEVASYDKIIPQFGTDTNYYSVLKYLFHGRPPPPPSSDNTPHHSHHSHHGPSVNMAGVADNVAAFLAHTTSTIARSLPALLPTA
ncbi:hypothetical protein Pcinc_043374 [Petrolisthes cinctipes]|uniref:Uncharacterized protein n=1 Tax=Petrolisthes cinctipes TaxID=88211 RepID=A0AAE1BG47_PETCI|nr:hypothetical protein Pcinc_043374 [Petrolisthes cinctipes]